MRKPNTRKNDSWADTCPCLGAVVAGLNQRRGTISNTEVRQEEFTVTADVALSEMFGYSAQLRGATQGKGKEESVNLF